MGGAGSQWTWGGCGDDVSYGLRFSKAFLDARETDESSQSLMNLHNNRAGRKALADKVKIICKCHGVSGSCTARTCWTSQPELRLVAEYLALSYGRALQVEPVRGRRAMRPLFLKLRRSAPATNARTGPDYPRKPSVRRLVFLIRSPDYCDANERLGASGISGRLCGVQSSSSSSGGVGGGHDTDSRWTKWFQPAATTAATATEVAFPVNDCEAMCCGRPVDERHLVTVGRCHCRFHWCCWVTCETCRDVRTELTCR
jgi:wingless-type MMTV integration site family protein 7